MNLLLIASFLLNLVSGPSKPAEGSPYFPEFHTSATISLKQGRVLSQVTARIDMVTMETHFFSNNIETKMPATMVKQVVFADSSSGTPVVHTMRNGYPAIDLFSSQQFYLVLADGKSNFLKSISKRVSEQRNDLTSRVEKSYETEENYFLFANGVMKKWKKDKEFFLSAFADQKDQLETFIQQNRTNFRNAESVAKLVSYYNTL